MSNIPNDIFSRIELLKKWQEEQQLRLLKQQTLEDSREKLREALDDNIRDTPLSSLRRRNESSEDVSERLELKNDESVKYVEIDRLQSGECLALRCGETPSLQSRDVSALDYVETPTETDENLLKTSLDNRLRDLEFQPLKIVETPLLKSVLKTVKTSPESLGIEERELPTRFKDFNQLLDEKLKKIDEQDVNKIVSKPKRPFLKKGTGLVRFRLPPKTLQPLQRSTPKEKVKTTETGLSNVKTKKTNKTGVSDLKTDGSETSNNKIGSQPLNTKKTGSNLSDIKTSDPEVSNRISNENSVVSKVFDEKPTWANVLENAQNISEDQSLEQRVFEKQLERELLGRDFEELKIFEILEQKASNSSFCSTSSVIMRLMGMTTTPKKNQYTPQNDTQSTSMNSNPLRSQNIRASQNLNTQFSSSSLNCNPQFVSPSDSVKSPSRTVDTQTDYKDESAWSEESDESTVIESDSTESESVQPIYYNVATNTDPIPEPINTDLLRVRLEELESEIETFRVENGKVQKLKITMEKERKKNEKELEEERKCLEEEKKKLSRDKHLLHEKYTREMKNGVTRKEREEITVLKNELTAVKEELKQKESRYGASQARQRNQIRTMEKEIAQLKTENEKLRKQNGKLQTQIKLDNKKNQPPSDTKVLHEINKNLSLLTKQQRLRTTSENSNQSSDKENDSITDPVFDSIVKDYERVFGKNKSNKSQNTRSLSRMDTRASSGSTDSLLEKSIPKSTTATADRVERLLPDGTKETTYSNGNIKSISGNKVTMRYYNGDIKETNAENATVRYFYAEANIWHTTYAEDGLEVLEFPDGQVEKRSRDGSTEVMFPDGCVRCTTPDGTETIDFPDGTVVVRKTNGDKILTLPNGQREIHTMEHKRREYPDGTVKLLYPDGTQETRYANGRIRLKDSNGVLIMDTADV